jgi:hypothetical protein
LVAQPESPARLDSVRVDYVADIDAWAIVMIGSGED